MFAAKDFFRLLRLLKQKLLILCCCSAFQLFLCCCFSFSCCCCQTLGMQGLKNCTGTLDLSYYFHTDTDTFTGKGTIMKWSTFPFYLHPFAVKEWNFHLYILFFYPQHTRSRHEWDFLSRISMNDMGVRVDFAYPGSIPIRLALARCPLHNFFYHLLCQKLSFFCATRDAFCSLQFLFFRSVNRLVGWSVACTTVRACGAFATTRHEATQQHGKLLIRTVARHSALHSAAQLSLAARHSVFGTLGLNFRSSVLRVSK